MFNFYSPVDLKYSVEQDKVNHLRSAKRLFFWVRMMWSQNNSINHTNSTVTVKLSVGYSGCHRFPEDKEYFTAHIAVSLASIILNMLTCPVIILMNALVIVVVKTRPRLQTIYRILLACLAGTDLFTGTIVQPTFITTEIIAIAGGSKKTYCNIFGILKLLIEFSPVVSLFHLVLISIDRFIALKYSFRYNDIATKRRLALAVTFSWVIAVVYSLLRTLIPSLLPVFSLPFLLICCILIILYCHISVYFITRRHEKQIKTEQICGEAARNFLREKKAWKTTRIIIGAVFLSFLPGVLFTFLIKSISEVPRQTLIVLGVNSACLFLLNSMYNPVIYCWKSKEIRRAMINLVGKS